MPIKDPVVKYTDGQYQIAYPFSLAVDGSNDTDLRKMNSLTVRIFDSNRGQTVTRFVDMGMTSGSDTE